MELRPWIIWQWHVSADPSIATVDERSEEAVVPASSSKPCSGETLADEKSARNLALWPLRGLAHGYHVPPILGRIPTT